MQKFLNAFCHLCRKLHDDSEPPKIVDLRRWWYEGGRCGDKDYWYPNKDVSEGKNKGFARDRLSPFAAWCMILVHCFCFLIR